MDSSLKGRKLSTYLRAHGKSRTLYVCCSRLVLQGGSLLTVRLFTVYPQTVPISFELRGCILVLASVGLAAMA